MRVSFLAVLVVLVAAVGATSAGAKGKPGYACPPGFNIGAVTPGGALALERSQAPSGLASSRKRICWRPTGRSMQTGAAISAPRCRTGSR
jgi:hypothetical protein